jgi:hypothetical protein
MKYLKKFESLEFDENSPILESTLHYSPRFKAKLQKILKSYSHTPITFALFGKEGEEIRQDWTFIDSEDDSEELTFINQRKAQEMVWPAHKVDLDVISRDTSYKIWNSDLVHGDTGISSKSRNNIKIGRFVRGILGNQFSDKEIEEFVNQFKSIKDTDKLEFKLVSGEEIKKWYNPENCKYAGKGSLGSSCMQVSEKNNFFKLYTENTDTCQLLILLEGGKLVGRALVWKLKSAEITETSPEEKRPKKEVWKIPGVDYFMDRVYTSDDYLVNNFILYADKLGWARKPVQSYGYNTEITFKGQKYEDVSMSVKVKKLDYRPYPYLDTFTRYNHFNGTLHNDEDSDKGGHILISTGGGFKPSIPKSRYIINNFKRFVGA